MSKKQSYHPLKNAMKEKEEYFFNDIQQIVDMLENCPNDKVMIAALKNTIKRGYNLVKLT
jgi:hypothetical protein